MKDYRMLCKYKNYALINGTKKYVWSLFIDMNTGNSYAKCGITPYSGKMERINTIKDIEQ